MKIEIKSENVVSTCKKIIPWILLIIILLSMILIVFIAGIKYAKYEKGTIIKYFPVTERVIQNEVIVKEPVINIEETGRCIGVKYPNDTEFEQRCVLT